MAFLVSNKNNIGYISGFWGSSASLIILENKTLFITDKRYTDYAQKICTEKGFRLIEHTGTESFWNDLCREHQIDILEIDKNDITLSRWEWLQKNITDAAIIASEDITLKHRIIKNNNEIENIQKAASIADQALSKTIQYFQTGITEQELAWIFEKISREEFGASGLSFDTIVAFAQHSACPHHTPTNKKLSLNMPILIDCGVQYNHYCSDMTRCFWFGDQNSDAYKKWKTAYNKVLCAQKAGIEEMYTGNAIKNAEKKAREMLGAEESFFTHSFGHGVGIDIHELPYVSKKNEELFEPGMIVTAEPGIYYEGEFGIRIEDLLLITPEGNRILSQFEK